MKKVNIPLGNKEYDTSSADFSDKVMGAYGLSPVRDSVKKTLNQDVDWDGTNVTLGGQAFVKPKKVYNGRSYAKQSDIDKASKDWVTSQGMVGIRDYSKNTYGMNNLGYADGQVTSGGKNFITPAYNIAGTTYANPSDIDAAAEMLRTKYNYVPVRQNMTGQGFYSDKLGYKDGNLTYYGNNIGSPDMVMNGVSYMDPERYQKMISGMQSDDVDAAAALNAMGISNGVTYNADGTVSILGMTVPVQQVKTDDTTGKYYAYVDRSALDAAYNAYRDKNPTIQDVFRDYQDTYGKRIERALKNIENPKEFEYDLEDDPQYQAYREAAERNSKKAHEDTLARMEAMTGGYANSNAIVAAAQARDAHLDTLNDRIPELYRAAYDRYSADRQREYDRLEGVLSAADRQYNNAYTTAAALAQMINQANQSEWQRRTSEQERNDNQAQVQKQNEYTERQLDQADKQHELNVGQFEESKRQYDNNYNLSLLDLLTSLGITGFGITNTLYDYAGQLLRGKVK